MIKNKEDYHDYLHADENAFGISTSTLKDKIIYFLKVWLFVESFLLLRYTKILRKTEYLKNTKDKNYFFKIRYFFIIRKYRKLCTKLQINIPTNTVSEGLLILHLGYIIVNENARVGKYSIFQPGTIIGQKDSPENVPVIGDYAVFAPGAKVIGKITIGNHVYIAPNSVVVKSLPDNCVVSGVPARIIKLNGQKVIHK